MISVIQTLIKEQPVRFGGLVAFGLLAGAYGFQFAGYPPCEMCWWQRYPYMAVIALTLLSILTKTDKSRWVLLLVTLLFATDASIAIFHAGVEQKWWEGFTSCSSGLDLTGNIEDALAAINAAPVVRCDEIPWSLFSISMAGYNAIIAVGMTIYGAVQLKRS